MRKQRSPALVLRRWPFSETSLTLRVLTPHSGTLSLLAKGVNRLKHGSFGVLDSWALAEIEYGIQEDSELLPLYSARLLDRFSGLDQDVERLAAAALLAEVAEDGAPAGQPAPEVFDWLTQSLRSLAELPPGMDPGPATATALMRGLHLLGFEPVLEAATPSDAGREWFSPAQGGLVRAPSRPHEHARPISAAVLSLLRRLSQAARAAPSPEFAKQAARASEPWDESLTILVEFLHYHAEHAPRAWPLLQERRRRRRKRPA